MAKNRFSLDETMADAVQNIAEAKNASAVEQQEKKQEQSLKYSAPEFPEQSSGNTTESDASADKRLIKQKKKVNKTAVEKESRNVRNVYLSNETLECLELIKKRMNKSRSKDEPFISAANIMNLAIEEYIDRNFPDIRKLQQMLNEE